jgi:hypothetical protein
LEQIRFNIKPTSGLFGSFFTTGSSPRVCEHDNYPVQSLGKFKNLKLNQQSMFLIMVFRIALSTQFQSFETALFHHSEGLPKGGKILGRYFKPTSCIIAKCGFAPSAPGGERFHRSQWDRHRHAEPSDPIEVLTS